MVQFDTAKTLALYVAAVMSISLYAKAVIAANLVQNPDFTTGIASWGGITCGNAAFVWDGSDGDPTPGSLQFTASAPPFIGCDQSACVTIDAQNVDLYASIKRATGSSSASVYLQAYTDTSCTTIIPGVTWLGNVYANNAISDAWQDLSNTNVALPTGTQSINLQLHADPGSSNMNVHFDHVLFGPTGAATPVRLQSFDVK